MRQRPVFVIATMLALALAASTRPLAAQTCRGGTLQVNSPADTDDGTCGAQCTLREAINAANADADCTSVTFDFSPDFNAVIALTAPLPPVTTPVHFLGFSHPSSTRIGEDGEPPVHVVRLNGKTNAIAGPGLRFVDAGGGLVEGRDHFDRGAALEAVNPRVSRR